MTVDPPSNEQTEQTAGRGTEARELTEIERQVHEIVGTITDSAVYGKLGHARFKTGNLPEVTIDHSGWDDFEMYPSGSYLTRERTIAQRVGALLGQPRVAKDFNYMMNIPGASHTVVDYVFDTTYQDATRRPGLFVHLLTSMPNESARNLKELIQRYPDAAEVYFQQAAAGLEESGVERRQSVGVAYLGDWDRDRVPLDRTARKTDNYRSVFGRDAVSELSYSRTFGSAPPRSY